MSSDRIIPLYEQHAREWDNLRGAAPLMERKWLDPFLTGLAPRAAILDLGCGSGQPIARHCIDRGFTVTGVDSSPTLIGICRDRFATAEWIVADMRTLDLGRTFDAIVAWDSFFHLAMDDQRAMFPVFAKHAHDGTRLMFTSGPAEGEAIGRWQGEPLFHASLGPDEYIALLRQHGFAVTAHQPDDPECGGHTVWIAEQGILEG